MFRLHISRIPLCTLLLQEIEVSLQLESTEAGLLVKDTISDSHFWKRLQALKELTDPILKVIIGLETDSPSLSRVYQFYLELYQKSQAIIPNPGILSELPASLRLHTAMMIQKRFKKMYSPVMSLAYLVDVSSVPKPKDFGNGAFEQINKWLQSWFSDQEVAAKVYAQLRMLSSRSQIFDVEYNFILVKFMTSISWWNYVYMEICPELSTLAIHVLSIPSTSGSSERNWSAFSLIHSKMRNRLKNSTVDKLIKVYWNLRMLDKTLETPQWFEDDEGEYWEMEVAGMDLDDFIRHIDREEDTGRAEVRTEPCHVTVGQLDGDINEDDNDSDGAVDDFLIHELLSGNITLTT